MAEEPQKFVRVIVKATGGEVSAPAAWLEAEPDLYEVLKDRPAVDASGAPLPSKPRVSKGASKSSAASKAGSSQAKSESIHAGVPADNTKE